MSSERWTELTLSEVLNKWTAKNTSLPPSTLSIAVHLGIIILIWTIIKWLMCFVRFIIVRVQRLIMSYKVPLIIFAVVAFIFLRFLSLF